MKVIKRNGSEADFNEQKIYNAIAKANEAAGSILDESGMAHVAQAVTDKCAQLHRAVSVEEIQDMVEEQLMRDGAYRVAQHYVRYRYQRSLGTRTNSTDGRILSLIECNNEEVIQENANKNPVVNSVQRDYMAGEVSRDITRRLLLP